MDYTLQELQRALDIYTAQGDQEAVTLLTNNILEQQIKSAIPQYEARNDLDAVDILKNKLNTFNVFEDPIPKVVGSKVVEDAGVDPEVVGPKVVDPKVVDPEVVEDAGLSPEKIEARRATNNKWATLAALAFSGRRVTNPKEFAKIKELVTRTMSGGIATTAQASGTFGAEKDVRQNINNYQEILTSLLNAESKGDMAEASRIRESIKDAGLADQFIGHMQAIAADPGSIAEGVGSILPIVAATAAASLAGVPTTIAAVGTALVVGYGAVKSTIFDLVQDAMLESGQTAEAARDIATEAQSYTGDNAGMIQLGGLITALGDRIGVPNAVLNKLGLNVSKSITKELVKNKIAEKTRLEVVKEVTGNIAKGMAGEGIAEAAQEGQQTIAGNMALQNVGVDVDTFEGASSAAIGGGLLGGIIGGGVATLPGVPRAELPPNPALLGAETDEQFGDAFSKIQAAGYSDADISDDLIRSTIAGDPIPEPTNKVATIDDTLLDGLGVKKLAAVRKRLRGQYDNAEITKKELIKYANAKTTTPETKKNIEDYLEGLDNVSEQLDTETEEANVPDSEQDGQPTDNPLGRVEKQLMEDSILISNPLKPIGEKISSLLTTLDRKIKGIDKLEAREKKLAEIKAVMAQRDVSDAEIEATLANLVAELDVEAADVEAKKLASVEKIDPELEENKKIVVEGRADNSKIESRLDESDTAKIQQVIDNPSNDIETEVANYINRYDNLADGLEGAVSEVALGLEQFRSDKDQKEQAQANLEADKNSNFKKLNKTNRAEAVKAEVNRIQEANVAGTGYGSGQINAQNVLNWAKDNLSGLGQLVMQQRINYYTAEGVVTKVEREKQNRKDSKQFTQPKNLKRKVADAEVDIKVLEEQEQEIALENLIKAFAEGNVDENAKKLAKKYRDAAVKELEESSKADDSIITKEDIIKKAKELKDKALKPRTKEKTEGEREAEELAAVREVMENRGDSEKQIKTRLAEIVKTKKTAKKLEAKEEQKSEVFSDREKAKESLNKKGNKNPTSKEVTAEVKRLDKEFDSAVEQKKSETRDTLNKDLKKLATPKPRNINYDNRAKQALIREGNENPTKKQITKRKADLIKTTRVKDTLKNEGIKNPTKKQINDRQKKINAENRAKVKNLNKAIEEYSLYATDINDQKLSPEEQASELDKTVKDLAADFEIDLKTFETAIVSHYTTKLLGLVSNNNIDALPLEAVIDLNKKMDVSVLDALKNNDLAGALKALANTSLDSRIAALALKLSEAVDGVDVKIVKGLRTENTKKTKGKELAGSFNFKENIVSINEKTGSNAHTLIHEVIHAVVSIEVKKGTSPNAKKLIKLFADIGPLISGDYGGTNIDEFIAEAVSNRLFRAKLDTMPSSNSPGNVSALKRFSNLVGNMLRAIIGRSPKSAESALTEIDALLDVMISPYDDSQNNNNPLDNVNEDTTGKVRPDTYNASEPIMDKVIEAWLQTQKRGFATILKFVAIVNMGRLAQYKGYRKLGFQIEQTISLQDGTIKAARGILNKKIEVVQKWAIKNTQSMVQLSKLIYDKDFGATMYDVNPFADRSDYVGKVKDGTLLVEIWDKQRPTVYLMKQSIEESDKDSAQKMYEFMREAYKKEFKSFKREIIGLVDQYVDLKTDAGRKTKKDILARAFPKKEIGEYFPLEREGPYVLVYEYENIERVERFLTKRARDRVKASLKSLKTKDKDGKEVDAVNIIHSPDRETENIIKYVKGSDSAFVEIIDLLQTKNAAGEQRVDDTVINDVVNAMVQHAPEGAVIKSLAKRKGTLGYNGDILKAFGPKLYSLSGSRLKIKFARNLSTLEREVETRRNEIDQLPSSRRKKYHGEVAEALIDFAKFARIGSQANNTLEATARILNAFGFSYLLGAWNTGAAVIQLFQTPMITAERYAGKYGTANAVSALQDAMGVVLASRKLATTRSEKLSVIGTMETAYYDINDNNDDTYTLSIKKGIKEKLSKEAYEYIKKIMPIIEFNYTHGYKNESVTLELKTLKELQETTNSSDSTYQKVTAGAAFLFKQSSLFNSQTAKISAYVLEYDKAKKENGGKELNQEQIENVIMVSNAESIIADAGQSAETGARIVRAGFGRIIGLFKNYGLSMMAAIISDWITLLSNTTFSTKAAEKAAKETFKLAGNDKPSKKEIAAEIKKMEESRNTSFKQLTIGLAATMTFAGFRGTVYFYPLSLIYGALAGFDDEDLTFEEAVRDATNEYFTYGFLDTITNTRMSTRLRQSDMLVPNDRYRQSDASFLDNAAQVVFGAQYGIWSRIARSVNTDIIKNDDWARGLENMSPISVSNILKNVRYINDDGYVLNNEEEPLVLLDMYEIAIGMLGFPAKDLIDAKFDSKTKFRMRNAILEKRADLLRNLNKQTRKLRAAVGADSKDRKDILEDKLKAQEAIAAYNVKFKRRNPFGPNLMITKDTIDRSYKAYLEERRNADKGTTTLPIIEEWFNTTKQTNPLK